MSTTPIPDFWEGNLEELADITNTLLPDFLPTADQPSQGRSRADVNPRLIRHYTTQGLIDEPLKAGREARYTRRHLLQLLTLRKLMSEGHGAGALHDLLRSKTDAELQALLTGTGRLDVTATSPLTDLLLQIKHRSATGSPPAARAVPPASPAPPVPAASATPARPERWTRLPVEHGLELHVSDTWRPPKSPTERERLARSLLALLDTLQRK